MKLKPAREGLAVPDPERGDMLPRAGRTVPLNSYWRRRLRDGDVVEVQGSAPSDPVPNAPREIDAVAGESPGPLPAADIPPYWRELPWTQPKGARGLTLRGLASALSPTPIITKQQAFAAIEAALAPHPTPKEDHNHG